MLVTIFHEWHLTSSKPASNLRTSTLLESGVTMRLVNADRDLGLDATAGRNRRVKVMMQRLRGPCSATSESESSRGRTLKRNHCLPQKRSQEKWGAQCFGYTPSRLRKIRFETMRALGCKTRGMGHLCTPFA